MGAGKLAIVNHKTLCDKVALMGTALGLHVQRRFRVGETVWGTKRVIDMVFTNTKTDEQKQLGVHCFTQDASGSAYVKFWGLMEDAKYYPMRGVLVYEGEWFKDKFKGTMNSLGAIALEKFDHWMRVFFNL